MKTALTAACLATLMSATALAAGYTGPNAGEAAATNADQVRTVEAAMKAPDDARVVLEGHVIQRIKGDNYEFKDATGTITAEIDHDKWPSNVVIDDKQKVRIVGEVDVDSDGREIDVHRIEKI